ncbi:prepilin peptidase [bacterium]|nr:prepilin peptidase [bacterium]
MYRALKRLNVLRLIWYNKATMIVVFVFILGLFVGSFLNVVVYRLHRQESFVKGYSKCLFCGHRLYTKDLVPLFSYLFLKGHCRYCQQRFSHQYPLVELFTGLAFVLVFIKILPSLDISVLGAKGILHLVDWWVIVSFLIVIFIYDLKYYLILDSVIWPAVVLAFVANLVLGYDILGLLLAAVVGGGFFLLQFVVSKGKWIGGGDIRLGFLMGIILGWPNILTALFIAYIFGSIISVALLLFNRKDWGDKVPFGTFLALATFVTMLYGPSLVAWYWSLFNL